MAKLKNNKIILVLMIIIFSVCFCACGEINSHIMYNEDNSVDEIVTISLNKKDIESAGLNPEDIKIYAQNKNKQIFDNYTVALRDKIVLDLMVAPADQIEILNSYINGISIINQQKGNTLTLGIKFKSEEVYKYFYGISDSSSSNAVIEEYFFYSKVIFKGNTLYARHAGLYSALKTEFEKDYPALSGNINANVKYTYVSDRKRQHSDADYVYALDGKYYHVWNVDIDDPETKEITMYYNIANSGNCILVSIAASLVIAGTLCSVGVLLTLKKQNQEQKKEENNVDVQ